MGRKKVSDEDKKKRYQIYLSDKEVENLPKNCKCGLVEQVKELYLLSKQSK